MESMSDDFKLETNVPLAPLTTFEIGGPARYYCRFRTKEEALRAARWAKERDLPLLVLGGGSNMLISDAGFPGLVLHPAIMEIEAQEENDSVEVTAGAGVSWDNLVAHAVKNNWAGIECLSGVPGLVGSTPIQNVGAYGQDVSQSISAVHAMDLRTGELRQFSNSECGFGYRFSRFKSCDKDRFLVLRVRFRLKVGGTPVIRYADLEAALSNLRTGRSALGPTLSEVREAVLSVRKRKGMVLDDSEGQRDSDTRSAGSFFLNPVITAQEFLEFEKKATNYLAKGEVLPHHATGDGCVKVPAAWLIENAGFSKGSGEGRVGISSKHALAVVNRGGATADEVLRFARLVRDRVRDRFGVTLKPEPIMVGLEWES